MSFGAFMGFHKTLGLLGLLAVPQTLPGGGGPRSVWDSVQLHVLLVRANVLLRHEFTLRFYTVRPPPPFTQNTPRVGVPTSPAKNFFYPLCTRGGVVQFLHICYTARIGVTWHLRWP